MAIVDSNVDQSPVAGQGGKEEKSSLLDEKQPNLPPKHGSIDASTSSSDDLGSNNWAYIKSLRPYWVEVPIFLYFLAYRGALTLKEQFVYSLITAEYTYDPDPNDGLSPSCQVYLNPTTNLTEGVLEVEATIQEESSALLSVLNLVRNVPALFTTLIICSYTDVVGRRWGILLPCLGGAFKHLAFLVVAYSEGQFMGLLYIGEVLEGLGGSIMTAQSCAAAFVTDRTPLESRTFRLTVIQCLHFLGTAVGNLLMGYLIAGVSYAWSFWYTFLLYTICFLWVFLLLPESAPAGKARAKFSVRGTLYSAVAVFKLYTRKDRGYLSRAILIIMLVPVISENIITLGRNDVDVLYTLAVPFCWTSVIIGYFQFVKYILKAAVGFSVKGLTYILRDATIGAIGALFGAAGNILMGLAQNDLQLWMMTVLSAPSGLVFPLAQSIMSKCIAAEEQGMLFASLGVVTGASDMFAATLLDLIYSASYTVLPGAVFLVIAGLYVFSLISFIAAWVLQDVARRRERLSEVSPPPKAA